MDFKESVKQEIKESNSASVALQERLARLSEAINEKFGSPIDDFGWIVLREADKKYQQMIDRTAQTPFTQSTKIAVLDNYIGITNNFHNRLKQEGEEFNSALDTINKRRNNRISKERSHRSGLVRDGKGIIWCIAGLALAIGILCTLYFLGISNGIAFWAKNIMMKEAGFSVFFSGNTGVGQIPLIVSIAGALLIVAVGALILIVRSIIKHKFLKTLIATIFLAPIVGALSFLLIRLLMALSCYLVYGIMTPIGLIVIGAILTILFGIFVFIRLETINFRIVGTILILGMVATTATLGFMGFSIHNENKEYYKAHDGTTIQKAIDYNNYKFGNYYIETEENCYIEYTPSETGLYQVDFENLRSGGGLLLDLIASDGETVIEKEQGDDIVGINYILYEGQKYYFRINCVSDRRECFSLKIKFNSDNKEVSNKIMNKFGIAQV